MNVFSGMRAHQRKSPTRASRAKQESDFKRFIAELRIACDSCHGGLSQDRSVGVRPDGTCFNASWIIRFLAEFRRQDCSHRLTDRRYLSHREPAWLHVRHARRRYWRRDAASWRPCYRRRSPRTMPRSKGDRRRSKMRLDELGWKEAGRNIDGSLVLGLELERWPAPNGCAAKSSVTKSPGLAPARGARLGSIVALTASAIDPGEHGVIDVDRSEPRNHSAGSTARGPPFRTPVLMAAKRSRLSSSIARFGSTLVELGVVSTKDRGLDRTVTAGPSGAKPWLLLHRLWDLKTA